MPTSLEMPNPQRASGPRRLDGRMVLFMFCGFFGVIFAMNAVFIHLAFSTFGGIEAAGAYRSNFLLTKEIAAAKRQVRLGWTVVGTVRRSADKAALVTLVARDRNGKPIEVDRLKVELRRPADARRDLVVDMRSTGSGRFEGRAANIAIGQWDLVTTLYDRSGERFHSKNRVVLK